MNTEYAVPLGGRSFGKSAVFRIWLQRALTEGTLVSDKTDDGLRTRLFRMPDGRMQMFCEHAK